MFMKTINIKIFVILSSFIFVSTIVFIIIFNYQSRNLFNAQLKITENLTLIKNNELELNNSYHSINVNYDKLTLSNKKLIQNIDKLLKEYKKNSKIKNIHNLIYKQNDNIDLIKRANSIVINSLYYIKHLSIEVFIENNRVKEKNSLILRKLTRELIDLSFNIKLADHSVFLEYSNTIGILKKIEVKNKALKKFKELLLMHSEIILNQSKFMYKNIKEFQSYTNIINSTHISIKNDILNREQELKSKMRYTQITLLFLLVTFIIIIVRFIRNEQASKKEQERLQSLISKNIIISTTNLKGVITSASEAYCKISGYSENELLGEPHNIIRHPDMPKEAFKDMWNTIKKGKVWKGNVKNRKKDGSFYWVYAVIEPVFNNNGEIISYVAIRTDITNAIALEEFTKKQDILIESKTQQANEQRDKAIKALKSKDEFLANMSHEIRTPLNGILGFVNILKETIKDKKNKEYLEIIDSSSQHLLGIINDILDFSKIESGKLDIENLDFDTFLEFKSTISLYQAKAQEKNINIILNINPNLPKALKGDILRIKQVISNLLSNAIKFTNKNKNITIDINYENSLLKVSIKDQGIGIAPKNINHIFNAFSQEDSSTTRKYGGTGLGLSISNELIKLMNGELKVKSELGIGSEFYFYIPLEIGEIHKKEKLEQKDTSLSGNILVVEDNKSNQMFMKVLLKKLNLDFDIANDGLEAIDMFKKNKYNAILMDENMPNMNGIEATKHILHIEKENNLSHTPIIALTANALKGDREKFLEAGMDEYLTKPINKSKLIEVLNYFINKK